MSKTVLWGAAMARHPACAHHAHFHREAIGYCGVTKVLENVDPVEVAPNISLMTRIFTWLVITRAPFLTAIIVPILVGLGGLT
jgi:hypothetical protein